MGETFKIMIGRNSRQNGDVSSFDVPSFRFEAVLLLDLGFARWALASDVHSASRPLAIGTTHASHLSSFCFVFLDFFTVQE